VAEVQRWPLAADEREQLAVVRLLWQEHETAEMVHDGPEPNPFLWMVKNFYEAL